MSLLKETFVSTTGSARTAEADNQGTTDLKSAFPTYAQKVLNKPSAKLVSRVDALVDQLCAELDALEPAYTEEERTENTPFLIDQKHGAYTVLGNVEDDLVEDDPYNMFVALAKGRSNQFEYGGVFHAPGTIFLSPSAKEEAILFAKYAAHARLGDLTLGEAKTSHREILHATNQFVACTAWECLTHKSNLLRPPKPNIIGSRHKGTRKEDFTWARVLRNLVSKWITKECSGYGNALVHALSLVIKESVTNNNELWIKVLNSKKSFKPDREALRTAGIIPDLNIRQYTNLFTPIEMEEIKRTGLLEKEDQLKQVSSRLKSIRDVISFIELCDSMKRELKDSRILTTIKEIRSARLSVCSDLKREQRSNSALNMWDAVAKDYSRPKVRSAFAPGAIHIANGTLEAYSSANISSWIRWNPGEKSYGLDVNPTRENALAIRVATEFIQLMSG
ncbi:hypothetical protein [Phytophthora cinnamomi ormycovirus 1-1]|uniref:Uncharacterized protein n=1 Tax=Phytophthora cinnamomi ormycovirus 1-1 TaxID=3239319 RepID=A0AB39J7P3_9VIRU